MLHLVQCDAIIPFMGTGFSDGSRTEAGLLHAAGCMHRSIPKFRGKKVLFDKTDDQGRPKAFVHITTEENKATGQRELSLRRCERIAWVRKVIENHTDPAVLFWEKEHFGKRSSNRSYFFLEAEDFLVILEELKHGHYIVTAIYVDNPVNKKRHLKAHKEYCKNLKK
jgi:hypothetical protein